MSLFPTQMRPLPYRKPVEGRDYWVIDDVLPNADEVRARCLAKTDWEMGYPYTGEVWPGMRAMPALLDEELAALDAQVCRLTGAKKVWVEQTETGAWAHLDAIASKYCGRPVHYFGDVVPAGFTETEAPVLCRIRPDHVVAVDARPGERPR